MYMGIIEINGGGGGGGILTHTPCQNVATYAARAHGTTADLAQAHSSSKAGEWKGCTQQSPLGSCLASPN
jgi:hypothetical protein